MSCAEWIRGSYKVRNKTEYNKIIKKVVAGYNAEIAKINDAIKAYKAKTKKRDGINWEKFNYSTGYNWKVKDFIENGWLRRGGIAKANTKNIEVPGVTFDRDQQVIQIDVPENNWAVEYWHGVPGVYSLFRALKQAKWSQRGDKDGGYCTYWNEYHYCEGNGEPSHQDYFGRLGDDMFKWETSRPGGH